MVSVLFISHSSELRGAERMLELFLRLVDKNSFKPVVAMLDRGPLFGMISRLGLPVYDVPMHWWLPPLNYPSWRLAAEYRSIPHRLTLLRNIIRRHGCHLVHSNSLVVVDGALIAALESLPHVWHIHEILDEHCGLDLLVEPAATLRLVETLSDCVVADSEAVARQFKGSPKVRMIYNGVEFASIQPAELPGRPNSLKVAFVGNIVERKGPDLFVEACLWLEGIEADFYVIGEYDDPNLVKRMKAAIESNLQQERFHFLGYRTDLAAVLQACDIYVLSSRNDPSPRAAIEAMAAGCAVVATDSGGAAEAVRACSAGCVVEVSARGILDGLNRLIGDSNYMRQCQESARALVREKFSADSYVAKLAELLRKTAATPRSEKSLDMLLRKIIPQDKRFLLERLKISMRAMLKWNIYRRWFR